MTWSDPGPAGTAARSAPRASSREIDTCARCHARRGQYSDDIHAGDNWLDALPARRCWSRASTTPMASSATRSTPGARSCRAGCTPRASPAPTATIRTRRSCARPATACARSATHRRSSITPAHHHHEARLEGRRVRRLPHADDDLHGRRPAARSLVAHPAAGPQRDPRHAQRLQRLPRGPRRAVGSRRRRRAGTRSGKPGFQGFAEAFDAADRGEPAAVESTAHADQGSGPTRTGARQRDRPGGALPLARR